MKGDRTDSTTRPRRRARHPVEWFLQEFGVRTGRSVRSNAPGTLTPADRTQGTSTEEGRRFLEASYGLRTGVNLLHAGSISEDHRADLLAAIFPQLVEETPDLRLVVAGDGPYLPEMRARLQGVPGIVFTGRPTPESLPLIYAGCDFLVFPSTADCASLVVLEAQSCGLPALVSPMGGSHALVRHGRTGWVLPARFPEEWCQGIRHACTVARRHPALHAAMRREARSWAVEDRGWARPFACEQAISSHPRRAGFRGSSRGAYTGNA
jgi:glycosyltransferase involved in cell wall biosynthesis